MSVRRRKWCDTSGVEHEVDAIVYATGFDSQDFLESIDITGVDGQKLATQWADGAHAYLGMYVPHFPNLFVTYGPNTNLGGGSIIYMLEAQARHMRQAIADRMAEVGLRLHPDKTKIVYCKDSNRQGSYEHTAFTFLGFTFRQRRARNRHGRSFSNFLPAISKEG